MGRFLGSHPELVLCGAAIGFQVFPIYQWAPWNTQVWFRHGPHYHTAWRLQPDPAARLDNRSILTLVRFPPVLLPDIPLFSLFRTLVFIQRTRMLTTQGHCSEVAPNADLQKKKCTGVPSGHARHTHWSWPFLLCKGWVCKLEHEIETTTTSRLDLEDCAMLFWLVFEWRLK